MNKEESHQQKKEPNIFRFSERRSSPSEGPKASMGLQEESRHPIPAQSDSGGSTDNPRSPFFQSLHPAQSPLSMGAPTSAHTTPLSLSRFHISFTIRFLMRHTLHFTPPFPVIIWPLAVLLTAILLGVTHFHPLHHLQYLLVSQNRRRHLLTQQLPRSNPWISLRMSVKRPTGWSTRESTRGNREQRRESLEMQRLLSQNTLLRKGSLWRMSKSCQRWWSHYLWDWTYEIEQSAVTISIRLGRQSSKSSPNWLITDKTFENNWPS